MAGVEITYDSRKVITLLPDRFKKHYYKGIQDAMFYAEDKAKQSIGTKGKPGVITGHLRRSIQGRATKDVGKLGSDVIYSRIHELGGVILPVRANYLRFKVGGQWRSVKRVVMPKRAFLRPALEDNVDDLEKIIKDRIIKGLS